MRLRVCAPDEIKILLDACTDDQRPVARLTLESLLRVGEVVALHRDDSGPTYVSVVNSKSGKSRQVPVTPGLRAALLARCHAKGYVFGEVVQDEPPLAAAVSVAFCRLAKRLALHGVSHHTLRHTDASVMVSNGVSLRAVQTIGGWSTLRMVERYAHVNDSELMRAVRTTREHVVASERITSGITMSQGGGASGNGTNDRNP